MDEPHDWASFCWVCKVIIRLQAHGWTSWLVACSAKWSPVDWASFRWVCNVMICLQAHGWTSWLGFILLRVQHNDSLAGTWMNVLTGGVGIALVVRAKDLWSKGRSGRVFFSRVNFLCWLLFQYRFHPRVTARARKKSWSFCQKFRWLVTAKYVFTLYIYMALHEVT